MRAASLRVTDFLKNVMLNLFQHLSYSWPVIFIFKNMKLPIYQVDAFTDHLFAGNPAAVVPIGDEWPIDDVLQKIAIENNLSETAFFQDQGDLFFIFTPPCFSGRGMI